MMFPVRKENDRQKWVICVCGAPYVFFVYVGNLGEGEGGGGKCMLLLLLLPALSAD